MSRTSDIKGARPSWDEIFMNIAEEIASRGSCDRLRVGAVITVNNRVIATGYNGAPSGADDCDVVGHQLINLGDKESCARTIHAEENAILQCAIHAVSPVGGDLYTTASPCYDCLKRIKQVGITRVVYRTDYTGGRNQGVSVPEMAQRFGIILQKY